MTTAHPYENLTPDTILDAIELTGYLPSGSLLALNSYENRVYQVGLNEGGFIIAKFYRPQRWSDAAILEEHQFSLELHDAGIPVVPPLQIEGQTLFFHQSFRFAIYPRQGGRTPELGDPETLEQLGRLLGRLHLTGRQQHFSARPRLEIARFGHESVTFLLENGFVPNELRHNYSTAAEAVLQEVERCFAQVPQLHYQRIHGDCHPGNLLWTDNGPHMVDLDDCMSGPVIQDLWMLLSGDQNEMALQLADLMEGYRQFSDFDPAELQLVESLRALRMLHYSAWLARRWDDPAFPQHFPWFNTPRYWEEQMLALREQQERLQLPSLKLY